MFSNSDYAEKRDFIRLTVDCDVHYCREGESNERVGHGRNLSAGGVMFEADEAYGSGDRLSLRILPRNSLTPPLETVAEVIRADEAEPGCYLVACQLIQD